LEAVIVDLDYTELLVAHQPAKPRNREELAEMTALIEKLACNEDVQSPAMERFIETITALVLQYEDEVEPGLEESPVGVLKFLMEERGLRQVDMVPILGSKSYVSQILSGHRPISREAARKLAAHFRVSLRSFL
jgi:HTH-type transcriptional regulator/antitoxin HigA